MFKRVLKRYQEFPVQIKASFWFLICSFLQKGISVITTPIFTRLLSTAEYGQYSVFNSWMGIITVFATLNLYLGVYTQGLVKFDDKKEIYSSSLQGLTTTLIIFWLIIYLAFHRFWNGLFSLTTTQMLLMFAMMWATAAFSFWAAEQRVEYAYKKLVVVTIIASIAKPVVSIILVIYSQDKVTARILGLTLVEVVIYSWLYFSQMKRGKIFYHKLFWKHALLFNLPLIPHYLSQTVLNNSDRVMISSLVNDSSAGIYSLAYSISLIMTLFNTALTQTISPWLYKKIKAKDIDTVSGVAYGSLSIIAAVNLLLIAFAPEVVKIFAPVNYYDAIWVIPPVAMSVYFMFAYDLFAKFEFYYEKTKYIMIATAASAIMNIVLNYIFIRIFGYIAAAYTTLFCYILYAIFHYMFMLHICKAEFNGKVPYNTKTLLKITAVFVSGGFALLLTYKTPVIRYLAISVIFVAIVVFRNRIKAIIQKILNVRK